MLKTILCVFSAIALCGCSHDHSHSGHHTSKKHHKHHKRSGPVSKAIDKASKELKDIEIKIFETNPSKEEKEFKIEVPDSGKKPEEKKDFSPLDILTSIHPKSDS